jgi:UTP--glucose-1-phosphate uridylyltransferase
LTADLVKSGPGRKTTAERRPVQSGGSRPLCPDPGVFDLIREQPRGSGGEIQLTDGIAALLATPNRYSPIAITANAYDCGSKLGLMQASVVLGEAHPELGNEFSAWLKERQETIDTPAK